MHMSPCSSFAKPGASSVFVSGSVQLTGWGWVEGNEGTWLYPPCNVHLSAPTFVAALPVVLMPTLAHWEVNIQCHPLLNRPTSVASVYICHTFQQQKLK